MFLNKLLNSLQPKASKPVLTLEEAAALLKTTPEALQAFEESYHIADISEKEQSDNAFDINSRDAVNIMQTTEAEPVSEIAPETLQNAQKLTSRIVDELLSISDTKRLTDANTTPVSNEEIQALPENLRPQLTGHLCKKQIDEDSYPLILYHLQQALTAKTEKEYTMFINHFKQGLDVLDLDGITYQLLSFNRNSISHWFPALKEAADKQTFFKVPKTKIVKVPMPILQLTRNSYFELTPVTLDIVNKWAYKAFDLDENKTYFIKTGTYSSKFDFRNAKVTSPKEVRELGSYLLYIHHQANAMAGPLVQPRPIVGVSTTNEWCVREYIEDTENNPTIYHGMPLHTEYRVFIDCDTDTILGISPYWRPDIMKNRFSKGPDAHSADCIHDYVIFDMHEETLMKRYVEHEDEVRKHIEELLPNLDLTGQWSLDVMQNGNDFWLIDMALATESALSDCIPAGKLNTKEKNNWLPDFSNL